MLFQSAVPGLFQQLNMQLDAAASKSRKEDTAKRLDFYHDNQSDYIVEQLETYFSEPDLLCKYCQEDHQ